MPKYNLTKRQAAVLADILQQRIEDLEALRDEIDDKGINILIGELSQIEQELTSEVN